MVKPVDDALAEVLKAGYGEVRVTVHDGKIQYVDKTVRVRPQ